MSEEENKLESINKSLTNLDVVVNKAKELRRSIPKAHSKYKSFQDNFNHFLINLMEAQFHLDELNRECHSIDESFFLDIISTQKTS